MHYRLRPHHEFFVLLLFFFGVSWQAKANTADSLLRQYNSRRSNDTARVGILLSLSSSALERDPDSALVYARAALYVAEGLSYGGGIGNSYAQIASVFIRKNFSDSAIFYFEKARHAFHAANRPADSISAILSIGHTLYRQSKYDSAFQLYNEALVSSRTITSRNTEAFALTSIGDMYGDFDDYPNAVKYYLQAFSIYEQLNDVANISSCYTNLATFYSSIGDYKKAREFVDSGLSLAENRMQKEDVLFGMVNAGIAYGEMRDFVTSAKYFERAMKLADSLGNINWKLGVMNNLAEAYMFIDKQNAAATIYKEVVREASEMGDAIILMPAHAGLGRILLSEGKVREGLVALRIAYDIAMANGFKEQIANICQDISGAYEKVGDASSALKYYKIYREYKDSVDLKKHDKQIQQMQYQFDLSKKNSKIKLLDETRELEAARSRQKTLLIWILVVGVLLLVLISTLTWRNYSIQTHSLELINKQKQEIEHQAKKLEQLNLIKDKTISILSHDLRGPLGSVITALELVRAGNIRYENFIASLPSIENQLHSVFQLINNLLHWAGAHVKGELDIKPSAVNLRSAFEQNINLVSKEINRKGILVDDSIPDSTTVLCDPGHLDIIVRNIFTNAVKFTKQSGKILLSAMDNGDTIQFKISDSGVGMSKERLAAIFALEQNRSTRGTSGEVGYGLGLILVHEFVTANHGTITADSEPNRGTTFTITLRKA